MVKHGKIMCVIACCVISPIRMAKLTHPWWLFMLDFIVCYMDSL
jgi:hypothetical protein